MDWAVCSKILQLDFRSFVELMVLRKYFYRGGMPIFIYTDDFRDAVLDALYG